MKLILWPLLLQKTDRTAVPSSRSDLVFFRTHEIAIRRLIPIFNGMSDVVENQLHKIHQAIEACRSCPRMSGTPVHGPAVHTKIMLLGQAPGPHEARFGKPFAYTSGKTLFKWFKDATGISEDDFRRHIYIAATARCFPGKSPSGRGDRLPDLQELKNCSRHLQKEVRLLKPQLMIAVGKTAISQVLGKQLKLVDVVGKTISIRFHGEVMDVVALPHPSGLSTWPHTEPGKSKLQAALKSLKNHSIWRETFPSAQTS